MKTLRQAGVALLLGVAGSAALAHTGHGTHGLAAGLAHPFGVDHLLAMVSVGVWSAAALPHGRRWWGPAVFMAWLVAGSVAAAAGLALPLVEMAIALSVAVLGAMLMAPRALPAAAGLLAVALAAMLHGLAHGAELPAGASFSTYAFGFLLSTGALHGLGQAIGQQMLGWRALAWRGLGAAVGAAGLTLLALG
jgi:urease accessory protein